MLNLSSQWWVDRFFQLNMISLGENLCKMVPMFILSIWTSLILTWTIVNSGHVRLMKHALWDYIDKCCTSHSSKKNIHLSSMVLARRQNASELYRRYWYCFNCFCSYWYFYVGLMWLVAWPAPSHYLNQYWNIVNWILGNRIQWNLNRNSYIFIQENAFENVVWKMVAILSRLRCVNR